MTVPLLDAYRFTRGTAADRTAFCRELVQSFKRYGFVRLHNHGVPEEMVRDLFHWAAAFFQLPSASKMKIANLPGPQPQRGWSRVGEERTGLLFRHGDGGEEMMDAREHFDQGSALNDRWPNRWPSEDKLPGFRSFMENYYLIALEVAMEILRALATGLALDTSFFTAKCESQASELRLNHYHEINVREISQGSVSRIHPHCDLGAISCLFQDETGGLEVMDQQTRQWVSVPAASASELVVNISETMERWTNGMLKAGLHQVTVPPHLKSANDSVLPPRISNVFFVKADVDVCVGALAPFVSEECPRQFEDMTALEYHQKRVATAYLRNVSVADQTT